MRGRETGKLVAPKREKGKRGASKGKRENGGNPFCDPISLRNQTARTNARTHARRERRETISQLERPLMEPFGIQFTKHLKHLLCEAFV